MRLHHRFSSEPLVELQLDYGSADGRTVAQRPYLWFHQLEDGKLKKRLKVIPLSVEEAMGFVELYMSYFLEASGQPDAVDRIHQFFVGCGFNVRRITGQGSRRVKQSSRQGMGFSVRRFLRKFGVWRKGVM